MPQMSPMNWFLLFVFFNFSIYLTLIKVHFSSNSCVLVGLKPAVSAANNMLFMI
uniref:ATP synthase F0 subunit 8 n=2 Tax=Calanus sinicus TaxID=114070 RepID=F1ADK7_CALSV|nr:ATP synthase F0 subunit 8 [Calanus sinicus]